MAEPSDPPAARGTTSPASPRRTARAPWPGGASLPSLPLARGRREAPCITEPCSRCCHDIEMILTDADVERIAQARGDPAGWMFEADDGYLQLRTRDGPPAQGSPGGRPCVFLGDDGRCSIWSVRPEGCRLYPAVWDEEVRHTILDADYCPHTDGFALPGAMDAAVRRLAKRFEAERAARRSAP